MLESPFKKSFRFPTCKFMKMRLRYRCFSKNFEKFFRTPFYRTRVGDCLIHGQVAEFQPAYTIKIYFTGAFQAFCTTTRSSHSKVFI